jgi:hypothetical protein
MANDPIKVPSSALLLYYLNCALVKSKIRLFRFLAPRAHTTFYIRLYFFMLKGSVQPNSKRHECEWDTDTDDTAQLPAMGNNKVKECAVQYLGWLEQPREDYCTGTTSLYWTNHGRTPFSCTLWVPIYLSFNSQQGYPPMVSLVAPLDRS